MVLTAQLEVGDPRRLPSLDAGLDDCCDSRPVGFLWRADEARLPRDFSSVMEERRCCDVVSIWGACGDCVYGSGTRYVALSE